MPPRPLAVSNSLESAVKTANTDCNSTPRSKPLPSSCNQTLRSGREPRSRPPLISMPQIITARAKDDSCRDLITVVLSQDAVCLGPDGEPWAGVSLDAQLARSLAGRLLQLANEIEAQEEKAQPSFRCLVQITSVLVFHDGSGQGHRAVSLAFDFASRSHACVQIAGIY